MMQTPESGSLHPPDSMVAPHRNLRGRRFALFGLHIATLVAAMSLTPAGYFFQLGEYTGYILLFGCPALWLLLFSAQERWGIILFCILALGQTSFVGLVALQLRSEDRVLQSVIQEQARMRDDWASQMQQFRMDSLFEMTSGKRQLSITELRELQIRARSGKEKLAQLHSDLVRTIADMERRIAATSSEEADNFRHGVETSQPITDEQMKHLQDYFTGIEQLTGFLIDRQGQYLQTSKGVVFKTEKDDRTFDEQVDAINKQRDAIARFDELIRSGQDLAQP